MSKKKISHSAWKKYHECPKLYDLHYNELLRAEGNSSALAFGSAVDEALNVYLSDIKDPDIEERVIDKFQEHFGVDLCKELEYSNKDYDEDIFDEEQKARIAGADWNYKCWASLRVKGARLLEAYITTIGPQIEEVISVQREITGRPGVLDAILKLKGHGTVLIDNKTSARPYHASDTARSTQLALYAAAEGLTKVGFIVLNKQFVKQIKKVCQKCGFDGSTGKFKTCSNTVGGKRCHGAWNTEVQAYPFIQLLVDNIHDQTKGLVKESISSTEDAIDKGIFPRNLNACNKMYGKPCPMYNKCWFNSERGLTKKEKK